ncbi:MAG: glycosyltransferase family 2 protein [Lachnospiraceae bacterium]|nr:glycosyltransferase family 2 protein [Lachnospiraceae bacterium]
MKKIGIVICNYNKEDMVLDCIQSILESKFTDYKLFVVDNASTDHSVEKIRERYGSVIELIVNSENLGGSGGFNAGLRKAYAEGYPYLMCVDNDALLDENAIGTLYAFLEEHQECGMAAAKIYHLENPGYVQQFGQKIDFERFCTSVNYYNAFEDNSMPEFLYTDSVAACALMVRRSLIDEIGFMPEENFLYWDDTEWCYRCNLAGHKVASVGSAKALHAMGAKKEAVNTFPTYYAWRNWIVFFMKYTPEDKLEQMTTQLLESMFQIVYEGQHNQEFSRCRTVMLAYDDAIHGIMGKAGENRIFDIDFNYSRYKELFASNQEFYLEENGYELMAERVKGIAQYLGFQVQWLEQPKEGACVIHLCENIFEIDDMSRRKVYIDINDCVFITEDDALDVINYNYSMRSFLFAQKPVFLDGIRKMRKEWEK